MKRSIALAALATALGAATFSPFAAAQMADEWRFHALIYGYLPEISGSTSFPAGGGSSISVDPSQIIDHLKFTFMGTFEAQKGRYGFITDVLYLNVGGSQSNSRNLSIRNHELPVGVSSNLELDIKSVLWTLGGEYRIVADPATSVDVLAGARLLDMKQTLNYQFNADVGPLVGPARTGSSEVSISYWDAIVGAKGHFSFGSERQWIVPWYADVGTGQSELTWQVIGGLGYQYSWGQVLAGWRYLDYKFKSGSLVQDLNMNGPMFGVAFTW